MPSAVTVRLKDSGALVCFGPVSGGYDPGFDASTMVKAVEQGYDTVKQEFAAAVPPQPQVKQFEGALKVIYANNLQALNQLMAKYPLFLWSLRDENWPYVSAMFLAAVGAGDITAKDWANIQDAAKDKNIPL